MERKEKEAFLFHRLRRTNQTESFEKTSERGTTPCSLCHSVSPMPPESDVRSQFRSPVRCVRASLA